MSEKLYGDDEWNKVGECDPFPWRHYEVALINESGNRQNYNTAEYLRGCWYSEEGVKLDQKTVVAFRRLPFGQRQKFGHSVE